MTDDITLRRVLIADDVDALRAMLSAGEVGMAQKYDNGRTLLHRAATIGAGRIIDFLLRGGATVSTRNVWGMSPLADAVRSGEVGVIMPLIEAGADVHEVDGRGNTLLHQAILSRSAKMGEMLPLLIRLGVSLDRKNVDGNSAREWILQDRRYRGLLGES